MPRNMGTTDRVVRTLVAVVAVVAALVVGPASALGIVLWVVAGLMLVTAALAYCPVYSLLRIDTIGRRRSRV
jgi:hypothetical protein